MKFFIRLFTIALFISFSITAMSCAKDNYKHNYKSKRQGTSTSTLAVETKKQPVRKNFIIPDKKKKILGQKPPRTF
jgi:flagellar biosynthesis protein FliP